MQMTRMMYLLPKLCFHLAAISLVLISPAAFAETYTKGKLNIKCSCSVGNQQRTEWHHIFDVPNDNFQVEFANTCEQTRDHYDGPDVLCLGDYRGEEYAFDPSP